MAWWGYTSIQFAFPHKLVAFILDFLKPGNIFLACAANVKETKL